MSAIKDFVSPQEFYDLADTALQSSSPIIVKVQITNLSWVNAQFGDLAGESVLATVRGAIRLLHPQFKVGQISPTLYGILAPELLSESVVMTLIQRLVDHVNDDVSRPFLIELAVGVVVTDRNVDSAHSYWVGHANLALLESTRTRRIERYSRELEIRQEIRLELGRLNAPKRKPPGMRWVYQDVVWADSRRVAGSEALIRWDHPKLGAIPPDTFIPFAEESGVIRFIDAWTVEQVIADAPKILTADRSAIGINISARTLVDDPNFAKFILKQLAKAKLAPEHLIVELTETAIISDAERVRTQLEQLARKGVQLSIDDFGRGETNLFSIATLPVRFLKLDRSLLEVGSPIEVRSMLTIGKELGVKIGAKVLTEGVETEADLIQVQSVGIEFAQGWLFGKPRSVEEIIASEVRMTTTD